MSDLHHLQQQGMFMHSIFIPKSVVLHAIVLASLTTNFLVHHCRLYISNIYVSHLTILCSLCNNYPIIQLQFFFFFLGRGVGMKGGIAPSLTLHQCHRCKRHQDVILQVTTGSERFNSARINPSKRFNIWQSYLNGITCSHGQEKFQRNLNLLNQHLITCTNRQISCLRFF